jgi:predicted amidohydrolase YtcJ
MREAHAHVLAFGRAMSTVMLWQCRSRAEALDAITRAWRAPAAPLQPGSWLVATGARPEAWHDHANHAHDSSSAGPRHGQWPTIAELDAACPDRPCLVMGFDHHSGAANSLALAATGIDHASPNPDGGVIVRDSANRLTGVLLESAFNAARRAIPEPSPAEHAAHLRLALARFAALGFTEVHDLLTPVALVAAARALGEHPAPIDAHNAAASGSQPARVATLWLYAECDRDRTLERVADAFYSAPVHTSNSAPALRLAGGKVFADGTLNAATAWMLQPYAKGLPDHPRGTPLVSVDSLRLAMRRCWTLPNPSHSTHGVGLAVHAIGDAAVRAVIDAAEAELKVPTSRDAARRVRDAGLPPLRVEHAELIAASDVPRLAALHHDIGLVVSVQPCHLLYDVEALESRLPDRLDRVLPLKELIDAGLAPGVGLWFGSDAPIVRPDPEDSIIAATHRARREGSPGGSPSRPIAPAQAITEAQARACFAHAPA